MAHELTTTNIAIRRFTDIDWKEWEVSRFADGRRPFICELSVGEMPNGLTCDNSSLARYVTIIADQHDVIVRVCDEEGRLDVFFSRSMRGKSQREVEAELCLVAFRVVSGQKLEGYNASAEFTAPT